MDERWSWHQLAKARPAQLEQKLTEVVDAVGRPLRILVETHIQEGGDDEDRRTANYLYLNETLLRRACPSSIDELLNHLTNVKAGYWADVWFTAEFGAKEVQTMTPESAAKVLFGFWGLLKWLRLKPEY